ncbi:MAG: PDDEXK nuclease domain-containing protein [Candidatus Margulisbacteria bacterium]|jgi:predicted nuclease of restriction endonuclease-like (RecB) superfamily|nr:PDDEXK nuclease domain-containing protein [Candidatus Margulisiibacteriota bacterium]
MLLNNTEYLSVLSDIRSRIKAAQYRASLSVNHELLALYWSVGKTINEHKIWGGKFIQNLSRDIKGAFPNLQGFSVRNMQYMAQFAGIYTEKEFTQQPVAQLPWRHHVVLMDSVKNATERKWYASQALENGWSSNVLDMQIENDLYKRQALADKTTNFKRNLPSPQSDLAQQSLKDSYIFDFIEARQNMMEHEIEHELVGRHITQFLLELGAGFAFIGNQYHLEIGDQDFYIDLLFYNLKLRCYVVIELKAKEFKPEYAGKLNFYVSAVDDMLKSETDNPTIGILLCRKKNKLIAEYALKDIDKPISVNEFKLLAKLPKEYENILPTAEDIEKRLKLPEQIDEK